MLLSIFGLTVVMVILQLLLSWQRLSSELLNPIVSDVPSFAYADEVGTFTIER